MAENPKSTSSLTADIEMLRRDIVTIVIGEYQTHFEEHRTRFPKRITHFRHCQALVRAFGCHEVCGEPHGQHDQA